MKKFSPDRGTTLKVLTLFTITSLASVGHYVDNIMYWSSYPEPPWLYPHLVEIFWFVMTPVGLVGMGAFQSGRVLRGSRLLFAYGVMNLFSLGHYNVRPPWEISAKINALIGFETIAALCLMGYIAHLHRTGRITA